MRKTHREVLAADSRMTDETKLVTIREIDGWTFARISHSEDDDIHNWGILYQVQRAYAEFRVYAIAGIDSETGELLWEHEAEDHRHKYLPELPKQPYAHGSVKFDGCSNLYFDEQDSCMLHSCGFGSLAELECLILLVGEQIDGWLDN